MSHVACTVTVLASQIEGHADAHFDIARINLYIPSNISLDNGKNGWRSVQPERSLLFLGRYEES